MDIPTIMVILGAVATLLTSIAELIKAIATLIDSIKRLTASANTKIELKNMPSLRIYKTYRNVSKKIISFYNMFVIVT